MTKLMLILVACGNLLGGIAIAADSAAHASHHGSHLPGDHTANTDEAGSEAHSDHCGHTGCHLLACASASAALHLGPASPHFPALAATFSSADHRPAIPPNI